MNGDEPAEGADSDPDGSSAFVIHLGEDSRVPGPVADLRGLPRAPPRRAIADAVRTGGPMPIGRPAVRGPAPGPVHAHVARLAPETAIDRRAALADVAVARGIETDHDAALASARRALRTASPEPVDAAELRGARRRAAETGSETERLRERVATIRGRVTALRDADSAATADALAAAEASLSETTRRLSEVATERIAAEQRLSLLEERARAARDRRGTRLRLEDRVGNLERAVRADRVAATAEDFAAARRQVAAEIDTDVEPPTALVDRADADSADPTTLPDLLDALAAARLAPLRAPVVVAPAVVEAFGGAAAAFESLEAPLVIR